MHSCVFFESGQSPMENECIREEMRIMRLWSLKNDLPRLFCVNVMDQLKMNFASIKGYEQT
jgi:hypothetical protein